jgi:hypothetical protein
MQNSQLGKTASGGKVISNPKDRLREQVREVIPLLRSFGTATF